MTEQQRMEDTMALCDYRLCDRCGGKAFYDANLNYGDPGATRVRGQNYTLDHVGDWAVLCQTCAETHWAVILSSEGIIPKPQDGWRRCAVGQRETQHCGMAEEARAQERERITAAVEALKDGYWKRLRLSDSNPYVNGAFDALSLALHAIDGEDTPHAD